MVDGGFVMLRIFINKPIKDKHIQKIIRQISESPDKEVTILIDSEGGDVESAEFLHGFLLSSPKNITTIVTGNCCSATVLIAIAGDERWAIPTARFMIHEPYDVAVPDGVLRFHGDNGEEIPILVKEYDEMIVSLQKAKVELQKKVHDYYKFISDRSHLSTYKIKKMVEAAPEGDWYLTAREAVRYGIVENLGFPDQFSEVSTPPSSKI
jgi:ATP-dependent protease ClpP protease subunit